MTNTVAEDPGRRENSKARGGVVIWTGPNGAIGLLLLAITACLLAGCSTSRQVSNTARTTVEQLLISQSIERSLSNASLSLAPGEEVLVETATLSGDGEFAKQIVTGWLRERGLLVKGADAPYRIRVVLHAFGTNQRETFFGIPPIQSFVLPISTPELSFYKAIHQRGYTRLHMEISDTQSGQLQEATDTYEGDVYFSRYTFLLVFSTDSTDLVPPP